MKEEALTLDKMMSVAMAVEALKPEYTEALCASMEQVTNAFERARVGKREVDCPFTGIPIRESRLVPDECLVLLRGEKVAAVVDLKDV